MRTGQKRTWRAQPRASGGARKTARRRRRSARRGRARPGGPGEQSGFHPRGGDRWSQTGGRQGLVSVLDGRRRRGRRGDRYGWETAPRAGGEPVAGPPQGSRRERLHSRRTGKAGLAGC